MKTRTAVIHDTKALAALGLRYIHPRAVLSEDGTTFNVTVTPDRGAPYTWPAGYVGFDGMEAVLVDMQNDQDEVRCTLSAYIATVEVH